MSAPRRRFSRFGPPGVAPPRGHALEVSDHAVARYRERVDPDADLVSARAAIRDGMVGARRLHRQGADNVFYAARGPREFRIVVRERPGIARAVVTVLPAEPFGAPAPDAEDLDG